MAENVVAAPRPEMVIFDCDGVLIDSEPVCDRVVARLLTAEGWAMTAEDSGRRFIGMSFHAMRPIIEAHLGRPLGDDWIDRVVAEVASAMAREAEPVPGAREALDAAAASGLKWRIASNSSYVEMAAKFGRVGWQDLVAGRLNSAFDAIARGGAGKPAPDVYFDAASAEGIAPDRCLVVEDSTAGATAARAAGMRCLGLARHDDGTALREAGAMPFHSMYEFPALLRAALA